MTCCEGIGDGTCYDWRTEKCCDGRGNTCPKDKNCCDAACCDPCEPANEKCCDDKGGNDDGYCCPSDNECCQGNCCESDENCCDDTCYDTATHGCCDSKTIYNKSTRKCCNEETGHTCLKEKTCCDGECCEVCCSDSGYYCCDSGETCCEGTCCGPGEACCDGVCYNTTTQKCCDGLDPCDTDYICDIDETCCDGLCVDPTIDQCCDDIGGYNDGYCCDADCELCCDGTCCDVSNCEICKNDTCVRAVPTNKRQTYVEDLGDGTLYFEYEWDSSTGDLADLDGCLEGEKVEYPNGDPYCFPSPPWASGQCPSNPYYANVPATLGEGVDAHRPGSFTTPYQVASFTATQVYQYHCGPDCCMGDVSDYSNWETLLNIGPIYRAVTEGEGDVWRYSIIKSGAYAEILPLP